MYNPLLGHNVRDASWYDIAEGLQVKIAYTCLRGKSEGATYHLNVLDLIDSEASAYWREWGLDLYSGNKFQRPSRTPQPANGSPSPAESDGVSIL